MASQSPNAEASTLNVAIAKSGGSCAWAASTDAPWVSFSGASSGADSGTLKVVVAPNSSTSPRVGAVVVSWSGGTTQVIVNQAGLVAGECQYDFESPTMTVPAEGGFSSARLVVTGFGCSSYALASGASWLIVTASSPHTTTASIGFDALPNKDAIERVGSIIATYANGSTRVAITQAGRTDCRYTLTPASQDVPGAGGSFAFVANRNTANGCSWSASTSTSWITLTGATTGQSGASVGYAVQPNASGAGRSGTINVTWSGGSVDFLVTQAP